MSVPRPVGRTDGLVGTGAGEGAFGGGIGRVEEPGDTGTRALPAHRERLGEFHERGLLLLVGAFADAPVGAMAVFATREAAEEFTAGDPFLRDGVVGSYRVRERVEVLQP